MLDPLFSGEPIGQALAAQRQKALEDVAAQPLDVLRTRQLDELVARWRYRPLVLNWNAKKRAKNVDEIEIDSDASHETADQTRPGKIVGMAMTFVVPFRGQKGLFHLRPSAPTGHAPRGLVWADRQRLSYAGVGADLPAVRRDLDEQEAAIKQWVAWVNREIIAFNDELPELLRSAFQARFDKIRDGNDFVASLEVPLATFEIPQVARGVHQDQRPASRRAHSEAPAGEPGNMLAQSREEPFGTPPRSDVAQSFRAQEKERRQASGGRRGRRPGSGWAIPDAEKFLDEYRKARQQAGRPLSQAEFAKAASVGRRTIGRSLERFRLPWPPE